MIGTEPEMKKGTGCTSKNCLECYAIDFCFYLYEAEMQAYNELNLRYVKSLRVVNQSEG